jgi:GntR family transcriptional regulator
MDSSSRLEKYRLIAITLAARIRKGAYDDAGLPGERDLAREFGVARVTIRNALRSLDDDGLVVRRERRGTMATSDRGAIPRRRVLRGHVDKFLDRGRKDVRKVLRFEWVVATPSISEALGLSVGDRVLRVLRVRSSEGTPLTYTEVLVPGRFTSGITRSALSRKSFLQTLEESGVKIGVAEQIASAVAAPLEASIALCIPLHAPVLLLKRIIYDQNGERVQLFYGWYRAERFEVRMRLSSVEDATEVSVEHR